MNIKSLLLGSAAALVAVSGARAADAVVMVEPEPVEYVRVCDVYGTGYFYIPGTETCLKIGGYVRMRVNAGDNSFNNDVDYDNLQGVLPNGQVRGIGDDDYNVSTAVRARLDFDAREETELGMLRAFARVEATNGGSADANYQMKNAYIQLGGLTMGYLDSLWAERDGLFIDNDWSVGDITNNRISYTFAVAGFTAAVSIEDDNSGDFVPDVVGQLAYSGGWGEAYVSGVYDEQTVASGFQTYTNSAGQTVRYALPGYTVAGLLFDNPATAAVDFINNGTFFQGDLNDDDGAFALKAGVTLKDLIAPGGQLKVEGSYAFDPTVYTGDAGGYIYQSGFGRQQFVLVNGVPTVFDSRQFAAQNLSSEWQIGAGYTQAFGKLTAAVSGIYGETFDLEYNNAVATTVDARGFQTVNLGNAEYWGVGGNVSYALTANFSVSGEVTYRDVKMPAGLQDYDRTSGYVEFKRTF